VNLAHHRPNQALDVPAVMWLTWRAPNDVDSGISTAMNERLAPKIGPVVNVE